MVEWIAIGISGLALVVSGITAWITLFQAGSLRMTQPTVIFFGPDGTCLEGEKPHVKVFLRTLLYSTSKRGQTIESMHVNLQRAESTQNFSIWVYGEERLARGSGLYVGYEGIACNHHFLLPEDRTEFRFLAGSYRLQVFAKRVRDSEPCLIGKFELLLTDTHERDLQNENAGIYFDWGPDQQAYNAHVKIKKNKPIPPWLLEAAQMND